MLDTPSTLIQNHQSVSTTKLLYVGNSGAGKTGSLIALAAAGFKLRILDLDNGADIVRHYAFHPSSQYLRQNPKLAENIHCLTITEELSASGKRITPDRATVWNRVGGALSGANGDFGKLSDWGSNDVLVVDSLTRLSDSAMDFVLHMNGRLGQKPQQSDWGVAQEMVAGLLEALTSASVKCNLVICAHLTYIGDEATGTMTGHPATLGKALSPKIGRYFNSILLAKSFGGGPKAQRKIITGTSGIIELKNSAPLAVPMELPLETGLADYFKAARA